VKGQLSFNKAFSDINDANKREKLCQPTFEMSAHLFIMVEIKNVYLQKNKTDLSKVYSISYLLLTVTFRLNEGCKLPFLYIESPHKCTLGSVVGVVNTFGVKICLIN